MELVSTPNYSDLFDGPVPTLEQLLHDIPCSLIVIVACAINAELHLGDGLQVKDKRILDFFLQRQSLPTRNSIYYRLARFQRDGRSGIFSEIYVIAMLHHAFVNFRDFEIDDTTPEQELRMFKSYLLIAELTNRKNEQNFDINRKYEGDFFHKFTWPIMAEQFQVGITINPITEMVRGIVFLNYFRSKEQYKPYLENFLAKKNRTGPWHYIIDLLSVIKESWTPLNKGILSGNRFKAALPVDFEQMLDPFCLDITAYNQLDHSSTMPFTHIRSKPLIKLRGTYYVLDWNAFAGKLYEGLVFDFHKISGIAQNPAINRFTDFKRTIGTEITEKFLFKKMLEAALKGKHSVLEFDEHKPKGHPDAYYRQGNKVILFELKDAYFPSAAASSTDFQQIRDAIDLKYNNNKKGTGQLIKQIVHLQNKSFESPQGYKSAKNLRIYPVILYTDQMFGLPGTNHYLQQQFSARTEELKLNKSFAAIRPMTFIDIRFFINYPIELREKQTNLFELLDAYQNFLKRAKKKAKRQDELINFFDVYQNFDAVITREFPGKFNKRADYVTTIVSALNLTDSLPEGPQERVQHPIS